MNAESTINNSGVIQGSEICFDFEVDGHQVSIHCGWQGRERIWVDDVLVVDRISWRMLTHHEIEIGGHKIIVSVGLTDWRSGRMTCTLRSDDGEIARSETRLFDFELTPGAVVDFIGGGAIVLYLAYQLFVG